MLHTLSELKGLTIGAVDGEIGRVKDVYFDDRAWVVRYLVVQTGGWLSGRKVLVTPLAVQNVDWTRRVDVRMTREQIEKAPDIDTEKPVSRQQETAYFDYYGYPYYWSGSALWGPMPFPASAGVLGAPADPGALPTDPRAAQQRNEEDQQKGDPNLRSANEVSGYGIDTVDGAIGEAADFLFDEHDWSLRFFIVDTRKWLPGRHVLVSTEWIEKVSWDARSARVGLTRDEVRNSPEYDREALVTEEDVEELHRHYGRTPARSPTRVQIR